MFFLQPSGLVNSVNVFLLLGSSTACFSATSDSTLSDCHTQVILAPFPLPLSQLSFDCLPLTNTGSELYGRGFCAHTEKKLRETKHLEHVRIWLPGLCKSLEPPLNSSYFSGKMGNRCSNVLKHANINRNTVYMSKT